MPGGILYEKRMAHHLSLGDLCTEGRTAPEAERDRMYAAANAQGAVGTGMRLLSASAGKGCHGRGGAPAGKSADLWKDLFPFGQRTAGGTEFMIYLDNGATSFHKPAAVRQAVLSAMLRCANPGRGGYSAAAVDKLFRTC